MLRCNILWESCNILKYALHSFATLKKIWKTKSILNTTCDVEQKNNIKLKFTSMKKTILLLFLFEFIWFGKDAIAQPISPMFNAQNYWLPARGVYSGQLESYWNEIEASGTKYMRIGGISYDGANMWSNADLKLIIDEMRGYGIEPIIQVPIDTGITIAANATIALNIVTAINVTFPAKGIAIGKLVTNRMRSMQGQEIMIRILQLRTT